MKTSSYTYSFKNGTYTITKGFETKFDWFLSVKLNDGYLFLDNRIFLTRKAAIKSVNELLNKCKLL